MLPQFAYKCQLQLVLHFLC